MPNSQALVDRICELRLPGGTLSETERRRYSALSEKTLKQMVASLEAGTKLATETRRVLKGDKQVREAFRIRKEAALSKLDAVADRIAERKKLPALLQAQQTVYPEAAIPALPTDNQEHLAAIIGLLERRHNHSILSSLHVRWALDEYSENWRRSTIERFAELFTENEPGNLITVMDMSPSARPMTVLARQGVVENYLDHALLKTSSGMLRLLDKQLMAGQDKARKQLLTEYARTAIFEPIFLTGAHPALTAAAATEALAKLHLFGSEFKPTRIISIGNGGEMVGHFLRSEMRLNYRNFLHCDFKHRAISEILGSTTANDRILVVSDIATDANDYRRLQDLLSDHVPASALAFAALAGRASTYDMIRETHLAYMVNLTAEEPVRLPWGRSGSYYRTAASHFFGHDRPSPLRIAKDFFLSVRDSIGALVR